MTLSQKPLSLPHDPNEQQANQNTPGNHFIIFSLTGFLLIPGTKN